MKLKNRQTTRKSLIYPKERACENTLPDFGGNFRGRLAVCDDSMQQCRKGKGLPYKLQWVTD
ncbi:hypothetical protein DUE52_00900 [Larkinella punicea]|uniref:Uncharacterized protein n=1 Tax=Larkinella punicea TaxID=2315727 RepID=A0A368JV30_9BACT|nr:hypothetical protein DUE52_00900 [Larkinella punicea]